MFQGHIDLDTAAPVEASAVPDVLFERGLYWASGRSGVVNLVAAGCRRHRGRTVRLA